MTWGTQPLKTIVLVGFCGAKSIWLVRWCSGFRLTAFFAGGVRQRIPTSTGRRLASRPRWNGSRLPSRSAVLGIALGAGPVVLLQCLPLGRHRVGDGREPESRATRVQAGARAPVAHVHSLGDSVLVGLLGGGWDPQKRDETWIENGETPREREKVVEVILLWEHL